MNHQDIDRKRLIEHLLNDEQVDLEKLYRISRLPGGFLNNTLRRRVWPKLLGLNRYHLSSQSSSDTTSNNTLNVTDDIERCPWVAGTAPHTDDIHENLHRNQHSAILVDTVKRVLNTHPNLHYYRGYYDVASVFFHLFEEDSLLYPMIEKVSLYFFHDCMRANIEVLFQSMNIIMILLQLIDPDLYDHINQGHLVPNFSLMWIATWFSHDLKSYDDVTRLYDVLLCSHPLYIFYLSTAVILQFRGYVLATETHVLHETLVTLPQLMTSSVIEAAISLADYWMSIITPTALCSILHVTEYHDLVTTNRLYYFDKPSVSRYQYPDWYLLYQSKMNDINSNCTTTATITALEISLVLEWFKSHKKHYQEQHIGSFIEDIKSVYLLVSSDTVMKCGSSLYVDEYNVYYPIHTTNKKDSSNKLILDSESSYEDNSTSTITTATTSGLRDSKPSLKNERHILKGYSFTSSSKSIMTDEQVFTTLIDNWKRFHDSTLLPNVFIAPTNNPSSSEVTKEESTVVSTQITQVSTSSSKMETPLVANDELPSKSTSNAIETEAQTEANIESPITEMSKSTTTISTTTTSSNSSSSSSNSTTSHHHHTNEIKKKNLKNHPFVIPHYLWWSLALLGASLSIFCDTINFAFNNYDVNIRLNISENLQFQTKLNLRHYLPIDMNNTVVVNDGLGFVYTMSDTVKSIVSNHSSLYDNIRKSYQYILLPNRLFASSNRSSYSSYNPFDTSYQRLSTLPPTLKDEKDIIDHYIPPISKSDSSSNTVITSSFSLTDILVNVVNIVTSPIKDIYSTLATNKSKSYINLTYDLFHHPLNHTTLELQRQIYIKTHQSQVQTHIFTHSHSNKSKKYDVHGHDSDEDSIDLFTPVFHIIADSAKGIYDIISTEESTIDSDEALEVVATIITNASKAIYTIITNTTNDTTIETGEERHVEHTDISPLPSYTSDMIEEETAVKVTALSNEDIPVVTLPFHAHEDTVSRSSNEIAEIDSDDIPHSTIEISTSVDYKDEIDAGHAVLNLDSSDGVSESINVDKLDTTHKHNVTLFDTLLDIAPTTLKTVYDVLIVTIGTFYDFIKAWIPHSLLSEQVEVSYDPFNTSYQTPIIIEPVINTTYIAEMLHNITSFKSTPTIDVSYSINTTINIQDIILGVTTILMNSFKGLHEDILSSLYTQYDHITYDPFIPINQTSISLQRTIIPKHTSTPASTHSTTNSHVPSTSKVLESDRELEILFGSTFSVITNASQAIYEKVVSDQSTTYSEGDTLITVTTILSDAANAIYDILSRTETKHIDENQVSKYPAKVRAVNSMTFIKSYKGDASVVVHAKDHHHVTPSKPTTDSDVKSVDTVTLAFNIISTAANDLYSLIVHDNVTTTSDDSFSRGSTIIYDAAKAIYELVSESTKEDTDKTDLTSSTDETVPTHAADVDKTSEDTMIDIVSTTQEHISIHLDNMNLIESDIKTSHQPVVDSNLERDSLVVDESITEVVTHTQYDLDDSNELLDNNMESHTKDESDSELYIIQEGSTNESEDTYIDISTAHDETMTVSVEDTEDGIDLNTPPILTDTTNVEQSASIAFTDTLIESTDILLIKEDIESTQTTESELLGVTNVTQEDDSIPVDETKSHILEETVKSDVSNTVTDAHMETALSSTNTETKIVEGTEDVETSKVDISIHAESHLTSDTVESYKKQSDHHTATPLKEDINTATVVNTSKGSIVDDIIEYVKADVSSIPINTGIIDTLIYEMNEHISQESNNTILMNEVIPDAPTLVDITKSLDENTSAPSISLSDHTGSMERYSHTDILHHEPSVDESIADTTHYVKEKTFHGPLESLDDDDNLSSTNTSSQDVSINTTVYTTNKRLKLPLHTQYYHSKVTTTTPSHDSTAEWSFNNSLFVNHHQSFNFETSFHKMSSSSYMKRKCKLCKQPYM